MLNHTEYNSFVRLVRFVRSPHSFIHISYTVLRKPHYNIVGLVCVWKIVYTKIYDGLAHTIIHASGIPVTRLRKYTTPKIFSHFCLSFAPCYAVLFLSRLYSCVFEANTSGWLSAWILALTNTHTQSKRLGRTHTHPARLHVLICAVAVFLWSAYSAYGAERLQAKHRRFQCAHVRCREYILFVTQAENRRRTFLCYFSRWNSYRLTTLTRCVVFVSREKILFLIIIFKVK